MICASYMQVYARLGAGGALYMRLECRKNAPPILFSVVVATAPEKVLDARTLSLKGGALGNPKRKV